MTYQDGSEEKVYCFTLAQLGEWKAIIDMTISLEQLDKRLAEMREKGLFSEEDLAPLYKPLDALKDSLSQKRENADPDMLEAADLELADIARTAAEREAAKAHSLNDNPEDQANY